MRKLISLIRFLIFQVPSFIARGLDLILFESFEVTQFQILGYEIAKQLTPEEYENFMLQTYRKKLCENEMNIKDNRKNRSKDN